MANNKELKGFTKFQDSTLSDILLKNFLLFYDWGFTNSGGYTNINIPGTGFYGNDKSKLYPVSNPQYIPAIGRVWQAQRTNWVWENNLDYGTPVNISGVFVNGSLVTSGYNINYRDGTVVFNSGISGVSNVRIAYSHKTINVVPADSIPWLRQIQRGSFKGDNPALTFSSSGDWAILGQNRVQLPCVAIEVMPPKNQNGYQLGGGKEYQNDIVYHVITENASDCRSIIDKIAYQYDRTIKLFNPNTASASGVKIFDVNGFLDPNARPSGLYPNLLDNFYYRLCHINDTSNPIVSELSTELYIGSIRTTTSVRD